MDFARRITPDAWRPRGIPGLEPAAWTALRSTGNTSVVAGPGAGKTEFLAQRAVYLLETGICPAPHRILAISFKTDAAANLAKRVQERCPPELASRFSSFTFDALTKSLVDRFANALPAVWRPTRPYDILFPDKEYLKDFQRGAIALAQPEWRHDISKLDLFRFEADVLGNSKLPLVAAKATNYQELLCNFWWKKVLRLSQPSSLTFSSLNRLAELLLRSSPHLLAALRSTYSFVFVDEFQDTTFAQYDFLKSAFMGSSASVTVVGDHKQRIMLWAGARSDAFEQFEADFGAQRVPLLFNFRSSPELVRVQHVVATALDAGSIPTQSQAAAELDKDVVQVWSSSHSQGEAEYLATWMATDMAARNKQPRDYALLVRQKAEVFERELQPTFAAAGLAIRNESKMVGKVSLQDLLVDDIAQVALALLRLGTRVKAPAAWQTAWSAVEFLAGVDTADASGARSAEAELEKFLVELRTLLDAKSPSEASAAAAVDKVYSFLDMERIVRSHTRYQRNDMAQLIRDGLSIHLAECAESTGTWTDCLDLYEGADQIPLLTVHKSKGLEYDTIAFIGLDDKSWWSYTPGNPEGLATFFVALSRAKQRAVFMFCSGRGSREKVSDLYQLLTDAGVVETVVC
ncbi:UvrD-helicase domain-containing protein [Paucibacter sp. M5-1]|uniref:UvrD-helicase domain-containing protein n=1 Tax=Paucibacter sp. M5-1 TaxID=3015998 RepID=UPI0022B87F92|nr:ATP-dependent helicase [Paucibacter sp. M5-1]MCZ7884624.1 ATP-dependent helicase [Paucibacter sp. M5-1]